jgi:hypothetical protein
MRPFQVLVDGKPVGVIKSGGSASYPLPAGTHRVQVKQDTVRSDELRVQVQEGATTDLECGSYIKGWGMLLFVFWVWRTFVVGKLFYLRPTGRAR